MSTTSLFDRVSGLVQEIGAEKQAAAQEKTAETGIPDPGGADGGTSHPSKKTDDDLQPASEGFQSADNERIVKDQIPDTVNSKPDATEGSAPKATDTQQGQGVDKAKPTGEDSSNESDYKGKLEGDKRVGDQGGTSHPATGDYGEKYSSDAVTAMDDNSLLKSAADVGNELTADIANGHFSPAAAHMAAPAAAAAAGQKTASEAGELGKQLDELASGVIHQVVKTAYDQADLVTDHLAKQLALMKKAEGEAEDPTSGAGEGEAHGTEECGSDHPPDEPCPEEGMAPGAGGGEEMPPEGAEALLAAMGGGEGMGGGGEMGGEMGGMGGPEMGGPEMGGMGGPEMGGPPPGMEGPPMGGPEMGGMGGPEMGGMGGPEMGGMGGPPAEMGGMGNEDALQQLAMALMEAGIDPAQLAALAAPQGEKIASAVHRYKRTGKFAFSEAKQGSAERKVRDYMKGFVLELYNRSRA